MKHSPKEEKEDKRELARLRARLWEGAGRGLGSGTPCSIRFSVSPGLHSSLNEGFRLAWAASEMLVSATFDCLTHRKSSLGHLSLVITTQLLPSLNPHSSKCHGQSEEKIGSPPLSPLQIVTLTHLTILFPSARTHKLIKDKKSFPTLKKHLGDSDECAGTGSGGQGRLFSRSGP